MIGLRRGLVELVPYDPEWQALGRGTCSEIERVCADLSVRVEHVGSTSVPTLSAKPIIDIALGVPVDAGLSGLEPRLVGIGYIYRGEGVGGVGHLFVWESEPEVRAVHVHGVVLESNDWKEHVCFRDVLRRDSEVRQRYEDLKRLNAVAFPRDRKSYTAAKNDFVREILHTHAGLTWDHKATV